MKIQRKNRVLRGSALHKTVKGGGRTKNYHRTNVSSVHNAVKNIKKVFEQKRSVPKPITENAEQTRKIKAKKPWKFRTSRGIVYVGHIPHGFYEEQMQEYFKQFGDVTRVRVARSKNTGRSRGYGYVEFSHREVAKIAAETMNNYLMCGRLLKAVYVSPEKQHTGFFAGRNWTEKEYPKLRNRELSVAQKNAKINGEAHVAYAKSTKRKLVTLEKKLTEKGVDLKFEPVRLVET